MNFDHYYKNNEDNTNNNHENLLYDDQLQEQNHYDNDQAETLIERNLIKNFHNIGNLLAFTYDFHLNRGLKYYILKCVSTIFSLMIVTGSIIFMSLCIDWSSILRPRAGGADDIIITVGFLINTNWFLIYLNLCYFGYWLLICYSQIIKIRKAFSIDKFYKKILDLSSKQVEHTKWSVIENILIQESQHGKLDFIFPKIKENHYPFTTLTKEKIRKLIHQNEDFILHIFREDFLGIRQYKNFFHSKLLVWSVQKVFIDRENDCDNNNQDQKYESTDYLVKKYRIKLNILFFICLGFLPSLIFYHLIISCFKEIQQFSNVYKFDDKSQNQLNNNNSNNSSNAPSSSSSSNSYFLPRNQFNSEDLQSHKWSNYAKLTLRNYHEYFHETEERLALSAFFIEKTIASFPDRILLEIAKIVIRPITLVLGIIITIGFFNPLAFLSQTVLFSVVAFWTPIALFISKWIKNVESHDDIRTMKFKDKIYLFENLRLNNLIRHNLIDNISNTNINFGFNQNGGETELKLERELEVELGHVRQMKEVEEGEIEATTETKEERLNNILETIKNDAQNLYRHKFYLFLSELFGIILLPWILRFHIYNNIITISTSIYGKGDRKGNNNRLVSGSRNNTNGSFNNTNKKLENVTLAPQPQAEVQRTSRNYEMIFNFNDKAKEESKINMNLNESLLNQSGNPFRKKNKDDDDSQILKSVVAIGSYIPPEPLFSDLI